jgi:AcrR family transcriptional regulator
MARPVTIKDEDLLRAAREVFLERGIQATTAEVAARAGVSEGTLFHRFKSKAELFRVAMSPEREDPPWVQKMLKATGKGDLESTLVEIGKEALAFFRLIVPLIMMSHTTPLPGASPVGLPSPIEPPLRTMKLVAGFFEAEMRAGRLRPAEPLIVGRLFVSAIMNQALLETVFRGQGLGLGPPDEFIRKMVHVLWEGIGPAPVEKTKRR